MSSAWKAYGRYSTIGLELVISMVLGFLAGRWADRYLGGHGYGTAAGALLGVYAGFRGLYKAAMMMQRESEREDAAQAKRLRDGDDQDE